MEEEDKLRRRIIGTAISTMVVLGGTIVYLCIAVRGLLREYESAAQRYGVRHAITGVVAAVLLALLLVSVIFLCYFIREKKLVKERKTGSNPYDELTGLPLKAPHKERMGEILRSTRGNFAYAICDVSDFKYVNETFGYEYGNLALKHIAATLRRNLKRHELVSRTSGDHFGMLLQYDTEEQLKERLSRILEVAAQFPEDAYGNRYRAVMTCGVYLIGEERDPNKIRARATVARKSLKKAFVTQIGFYSEEDYNRELQNRELENELKGALANRQFVVYFQPKYDITSEHIIGAEALIRWEHPQRGLIAPNVFIPICEENGFVREIDFFVFRTVCEKIRSWIDQDIPPIVISINFSRVHLEDRNFVKQLIETAREYQVPPKYLEIELTETALYSEMNTLLEAMRQIKSAGFGLSMDDFGSGYSSLHLLREMPVDVLKLDKGFLDDCAGEDTREQRVISHVISMAKDLEIAVLAEGVETSQQRDFLKNSNCDMIQGYYYAKPMPEQQFDTYIHDDRRSERQ